MNSPPPAAFRGPEIRELDLKCSFPQSGGEEDGEDRKARKKIRKIMKDDKLRTETRDALKEEEDRRKRIAEREALREKLREVKALTCLVSNTLHTVSFCKLAIRNPWLSRHNIFTSDTMLIFQP